MQVETQLPLFYKKKLDEQLVHIVELLQLIQFDGHWEVILTQPVLSEFNWYPEAQVSQLVLLLHLLQLDGHLMASHPVLLEFN